MLSVSAPWVWLAERLHQRRRTNRRGQVTPLPRFSAIGVPGGYEASAQQPNESVTVEKSSMVAMLLEAGEENAAVLLARSPLPDEIDTERNLEALVSLGLGRDQLDESARLTIGTIGQNPTT